MYNITIRLDWSFCIYLAKELKKTRDFCICEYIGDNNNIAVGWSSLTTKGQILRHRSICFNI